jgi:hypothetical protein
MSFNLVLLLPDSTENSLAYAYSNEKSDQGHRVHGCGGSIASLLPHKNATKIFLPIFNFEKIFHTSKYKSI